jgi:hypothetical protein
MHTTISKHTKAELLAALRERYLQAPKADKTKVLDEFVAQPGVIASMPSGFWLHPLPPYQSHGCSTNLR